MSGRKWAEHAPPRYQREDGSVTVPEALRPQMDGREVIPAS
jgi:seryl-tRNA synthetase